MTECGHYTDRLASLTNVMDLRVLTMDGLKVQLAFNAKSSTTSGPMSVCMYSHRLVQDRYC